MLRIAHEQDKELEIACSVVVCYPLDSSEALRMRSGFIGTHQKTWNIYLPSNKKILTNEKSI